MSLDFGASIILFRPSYNLKAWIYPLGACHMLFQEFRPDFVASSMAPSTENLHSTLLRSARVRPVESAGIICLSIRIGYIVPRKITGMTELAGVQVRYPLLSPELADFAGTIPPRMKVKKGQLRYLFQKAMKPVLPPEISRSQSMGSDSPTVSGWESLNHCGSSPSTPSVVGNVEKEPIFDATCSSGSGSDTLLFTSSPTVRCCGCF